MYQLPWTLAPYCSVDPAQSQGLPVPPLPPNGWDAHPESTLPPSNLSMPIKDDPGSSAISSLSAAGVTHHQQHDHCLMSWDVTTHEPLLHDLPDEFSKKPSIYEPLSGYHFDHGMPLPLNSIAIVIDPPPPGGSPAPVTSAKHPTAGTGETSCLVAEHLPPRATRATRRTAVAPSDDDSNDSDGSAQGDKRKTRMYKRRTAEELNIDTSLPEEEIRRLKRMLSNRESARRSRHRKAMQVQVLEAQVADLKHTCREVKTSNKQLKQAHNALREYTAHVSAMVRQAGLVLPPLPEGVALAD